MANYPFHQYVVDRVGNKPPSTPHLGCPRHGPPGEGGSDAVDEACPRPPEPPDRGHHLVDGGKALDFHQTRDMHAPNLMKE